MQRHLVNSKTFLSCGDVSSRPLPSSQRLPLPPRSTHCVPFTYGTPVRLCWSPQVNTIPASFHDGLLLFVQAVTETLAHGGTVTDGEGITQRMWNRSFQGQGLGVAERPAWARTGPEAVRSLRSCGPGRAATRPCQSSAASCRPSCPISRAPSLEVLLRIQRQSVLWLKCLSLLLPFHMCVCWEGKAETIKGSDEVCVCGCGGGGGP